MRNQRCLLIRLSQQISSFFFLYNKHQRNSKSYLYLDTSLIENIYDYLRRKFWSCSYQRRIFWFTPRIPSITESWRSDQLVTTRRGVDGTPIASILHSHLYPSSSRSLSSSFSSRWLELNTLIRANGWPAASGTFLKNLFPVEARSTERVHTAARATWAP